MLQAVPCRLLLGCCYPWTGHPDARPTTPSAVRLTKEISARSVISWRWGDICYDSCQAMFGTTDANSSGHQSRTKRASSDHAGRRTVFVIAEHLNARIQGCRDVASAPRPRGACQRDQIADFVHHMTSRWKLCDNEVFIRLTARAPAPLFLET